MTAETTAAVTKALAAHRLVLSQFISDIGTCAAEGCDWRRSSFRNGEVEDAHRAHVAAVIALLVEAAAANARAEALRDAVEAFPSGSYYEWIRRKIRAALASSSGAGAKRDWPGDVEVCPCPTPGWTHHTGFHDFVREKENRAAADALLAAADDIQALHPGEVKNSVIWLRERAALAPHTAATTPIDREAILAETLRLHDQQHGERHCDRKYVQVCPAFQSLILAAGRRSVDRVSELRIAPEEQPYPDDSAGGE